jgi:GAF domain-containing protein
MKYPIPPDETARLEALRQYEILDTAPEQELDDITRLASFICGTPIAVMSLIDADRQWFKSKVGLEADSGSRADAFCAHTIMGRDMLIVEDAARDPRFAKNPLVLGDPHIRFYAGAPLVTPDGFGLGSLCAIDRQPRTLAPEQLGSLEALARLVMMKLEFRRVSSQLADAMGNLKTLSGLLPICAHCKSIRDDQGYWKSVETYVQKHTETVFTHGICPKCAAKHFPGFKIDPAL